MSMIKLKDILKESSPGFENRKFGDPLPTLEDIAKRHQENNGEIKKPIMEKIDLDQSIVDKVAKLTDINNHNEARIVLAKEMKLKNLVKGYEAIMVLHKMFNQMNEMMAARTKLDGWLMDGAKRKYSNFKDIYGAF